MIGNVWEILGIARLGELVNEAARREGRSRRQGVTAASHRARHSPTNAYKDSRGQNVDTSCQPDTKHAADGARTNERDRRICLSFLSLLLSSLLPRPPVRVAPRVPILISTSRSLANHYASRSGATRYRARARAHSPLFICSPNLSDSHLFFLESQSFEEVKKNWKCFSVMNDKVFLQGGYRESRVILRRIVWKKKVWEMEYTFSNLYELLPSLSRDFRKLVNSYPLLLINLSLRERKI